MSQTGANKKGLTSWKIATIAVSILVLWLVADHMRSKFLAVRYTDEGTELADQGNLVEAMKKYEKALKVHPGFDQARKHLGEVCYEQARTVARSNNYEEAIKLLRRSTRLGYEAKDVYWRLAACCWSISRNEEALAALDQHGKRHPEDHRTENLRKIVLSGKRPDFKNVAGHEW